MANDDQTPVEGQTPGAEIKPNNSETGQTEDNQPAQPAGWQFNPEDSGPSGPAVPAPQATEPVTWTASEFVANEKTARWYMLLAIAAGVVSAIIYLLTRDIISSGMIVIVAILFGIFAARKPRVLEYKLNEAGLTIGAKFYPYDVFKSFSVLEEGAIDCIWLMPLKRFMPVISVYFPSESGEKIANLLSQFLPYEEMQHDVVDRFMRKIRF